MKVLVDTNAAIWLAEGAPLRSEIIELARHDATTLVLSTVTPWEIAIKWRTGRLTLPEHPRTWSARLVREFAAEVLQVSQAHAVHVADLPDHHSDPFDRLLIAQAQVETLPIITGDRMFSRYDVEVLPAR